MMHAPPTVDADHVEDAVDDHISACLDIERPVSFFLFAGAGSGKTRSLVTALDRLRAESGKRLRLHGQRVGVITYTNAACDEIKRRLEFDPLVEVSTIHSFVWSLIGGHDYDIRQWLRASLETEITELEDLQRKGRPGTKAAVDRDNSIKAKQARLDSLDRIRRFTYNPSGENRGLDSLNHAEVIKLGADFLTRKPLMQRILLSRFPILLVDESQDTNKLLMDAFLALQGAHKDGFCLGLVGDTMQRIYADGKADLGRQLPPDWAKPAKYINHRSPRRIVKLINRIRASVDDHEQVPRSDAEEGFVRLFVLPSDTGVKTSAESKAAEQMAAITGDPLWSGRDADVKTLTLEHHMAARRMGFLEMFQPLNEVDRLQTGLRDGSLPGLRLFSELVLPLLKAKQGGDDFAAAAIMRRASPLLDKAVLKAIGADQPAQIKKAREAVKELIGLWSNHGDPRFLDVLRCVSQTGLFEIPESLRPIAARGEDEEVEVRGSNLNEGSGDSALDAWDAFLLTSFAQIEPYAEYVSGQAAFGTHQGVKGLEFGRVMVVMDDAEARGFMFSYEKLFGAKDKTKADLDNERDGKETGIERTRRLFYVTCSRTKKSLALIAYSSRPDKIRDYVIREGWFEDEEVQLAT
jgi:DNA helicase-2/ATP-dependent DNA helicase PcrA